MAATTPPPVNLLTKPKQSFAQAAQSTPSGATGLASIDSLASLARTFPDLPLSEIVCLNNQATSCSSHNHKKKKMTTMGPSRHQALLTFTPDTGVGASLRPDKCTHLINQHLAEANVALCVESTSVAYCQDLECGRGHRLELSRNRTLW
jgi:hypothetical protein